MKHAIEMTHLNVRRILETTRPIALYDAVHQILKQIHVRSRLAFDQERRMTNRIDRQPRVTDGRPGSPARPGPPA